MIAHNAEKSVKMRRVQRQSEKNKPDRGRNSENGQKGQNDGEEEAELGQKQRRTPHLTTNTSMEHSDPNDQ